MRISSNTISDNILRQIQKLSTQQADLQNQVSTGQRITQPEDDPASVGRTLNLQSEQRVIEQYTSNATRALQVSQASYSGLQSIKTVSDRVAEIAVLGGGALNDSEAQAYATEVNELIEETLELTNGRFGSDYLYSGTALDTAPFEATRNGDGDATLIDYVGTTDTVSIPLSETTTVNPTTDAATNESLAEFLNNLVSLRTALNDNDTTAITTVQAKLTASEDTLVASLARHGGVQARIEAYQDQLEDRSTELVKLVSAEVDADLPTTIVELTQTQTAYEAALKSAVNIMQVSLLDYID